MNHRYKYCRPYQTEAAAAAAAAAAAVSDLSRPNEIPNMTVDEEEEPVEEEEMEEKQLSQQQMNEEDEDQETNFMENSDQLNETETASIAE